MIVPETAPTANRIANAFDQRRASAQPGRVAGPQVQPLGGQHHHRQPDAEDREGEVERQRRPHLGAAGDEVAHGGGGSVGSERTGGRPPHPRAAARPGRSGFSCRGPG